MPFALSKGIIIKLLTKSFIVMKNVKNEEYFLNLSQVIVLSFPASKPA
nr:hypothetical protein [Mucilaginibacter sp. X5P1]